MIPIVKIDEKQTADGLLQLFKRGDNDFIIKLNHQILMNSHLSLTEQVLAEKACLLIKHRRAPRVFLSGLGMGYTLRAALDNLPEKAAVTVVEINPVIADWCRDYLAPLTGSPLKDSRVSLKIDDASMSIAQASYADNNRFDAIILDMYEGTSEANRDPFHPFYGSDALRTTREALNPQGVLAVWTEGEDRGFEKRLQKSGFKVTSVKDGKGGPRHVVYIGVK